MTPLATSAASDRNKQPILDRLLDLLPPTGRALEIAAGTGQHAVWFAAALPGWDWQPTDADTRALPGLAARVAHAALPNLRLPLRLDATAAAWPDADDAPPFDAPFDLIYCANMLHIASWAACAGLMQGAARHLAANGRLVTYGPYLEDEVATSAGNMAFDADLRSRNPAWGIRRREDVEAEAAAAGLQLLQRHTMPANNLLLVFGRAGG